MIKCQYKTCNACNFDGYESEDIKFVYDFLRKRGNSVFFDIGAHVGLWIYQLVRMLEHDSVNCDMIAFEAEHDVLNALQANIGQYEALWIAAWNEPARLFLSKQGKEIGRMRTKQIDTEDIEVQGVRLDYFNPRADVFAAKIDVEGSEHKAIIGLEETLKQCKTGALVVELSNGHLRRYGSSVADVVEDLHKCGFDAASGEAGKITEACDKYKRNVHFVKG